MTRASCEVVASESSVLAFCTRFFCSVRMRTHVRLLGRQRPMSTCVGGEGGPAGGGEGWTSERRSATPRDTRGARRRATHGVSCNFICHIAFDCFLLWSSCSATIATSLTCSRRAVQSRVTRAFRALLSPSRGRARAFFRFTALSSLGLSEDLYEQRMLPSSSSHRLTHSPFFA